VKLLGLMTIALDSELPFRILTSLSKPPVRWVFAAMIDRSSPREKHALTLEGLDAMDAYARFAVPALKPL
jgi:hypothetical protein